MPLGLPFRRATTRSSSNTSKDPPPPPPPTLTISTDDTNSTITNATSSRTRDRPFSVRARPPSPGSHYASLSPSGGVGSISPGSSSGGGSPNLLVSPRSIASTSRFLIRTKSSRLIKSSRTTQNLSTIVSPGDRHHPETSSSTLERKNPRASLSMPNLSGMGISGTGTFDSDECDYEGETGGGSNGSRHFIWEGDGQDQAQHIEGADSARAGVNGSTGNTFIPSSRQKPSLTLPNLEPSTSSTSPAASAGTQVQFHRPMNLTPPRGTSRVGGGAGTGMHLGVNNDFEHGESRQTHERYRSSKIVLGRAPRTPPNDSSRTIKDFRTSPSSLMSPQMSLTEGIMRERYDSPGFGSGLGGDGVQVSQVDISRSFGSPGGTVLKRSDFDNESLLNAGIARASISSNASTSGYDADRSPLRVPARGGGGGGGMLNRSIDRSQTRKTVRQAGGLLKGRGKGKGTDLNVMIVGGRGVGKTSFANLLLSAHSHPELPKHIDDLIVKQLSSQLAGGAGTSVSAFGSDNKGGFVETDSAHSIIPPSFTVDLTGTHHLEERFVSLQIIDDASRTAVGTRQSRETGGGKVEDGKIVRLTVVDAPGLVFDQGKELENDRHLRGLVRMLENRFFQALREERKVTRQSAGQQGMIHLVIFLIDPRNILYPAGSAASATTSQISEPVSFEFSESVNSKEKTAERWTPQIPSSDLRAIERIRVRANVLPIVARADTLTEAQRHIVQRAMNEAFPRMDQMLESWGPDSDDSSEESDSGDDRRTVVDDRQAARRASGGRPSFVFAPERLVGEDRQDLSSTVSQFQRHFGWATIDALDPAISDFSQLYRKLLTTLTEPLTNRTREELYERFRTEQLMAERRHQDRH